MINTTERKFNVGDTVGIPAEAPTGRIIANRPGYVHIEKPGPYYTVDCDGTEAVYAESELTPTN